MSKRPTSPSHKPGLDYRSRDRGGEIRHKKSNTRIGTLREVYGKEFATGYRSDMKLDTLLKRTSRKSITILESTSATFGPALKRLADK
jgi:hypothetical protein